MQVLEATKSIVLNAFDLEIQSATIRMAGDAEEQKASGITFCTDQETATLTFANTLGIGNGTLDIEFKGNLNDKMKGFYRTKYFATNGEERYGAVTQL